MSNPMEKQVAQAVQIIASLLRGKVLDENTWRTTVKWRKIAREIGSTQNHAVVKRFVKGAAFDGKDVQTLVHFGLTLEDARHVHRCHELSHSSERSRAERHQDELRAMPVPLALQLPPTGPPPNIFANVAVWPPLPQPSQTPQSLPPPPPPPPPAPVREKPRIIADEMLPEEVRRLVAAEWARVRREHDQAAKRPQPEYVYQLVHLLEDELRPYLPSALRLMVAVCSLEEGPHPEYDLVATYARLRCPLPLVVFHDRMGSLLLLATESFLTDYGLTPDEARLILDAAHHRSATHPVLRFDSSGAGPLVTVSIERTPRRGE
ncbi:hypothetical protein TKK_0006368 [Trichogramma kaykai]